MELQPGGDFALELWQFYEAFTERRHGPTEGQRRDVRVTLQGRYERTEVPSVRLKGFAEPGLNQASEKSIPYIIYICSIYILSICMYMYICSISYHRIIYPYAT